MIIVLNKRKVEIFNWNEKYQTDCDKKKTIFLIACWQFYGNAILLFYMNMENIERDTH